MSQTYGYVAKLFLKSEFHHLREETNEKTGLLRKILWYSLQEHIQKIKLFIYFTEKAKKILGQNCRHSDRNLPLKRQAKLQQTTLLLFLLLSLEENKA